jgi:hypothetical protein
VKADEELHDLVARWSHASRAERLDMALPIESFRQRHPNDGLSRLAEVYLAWIAMERGELNVAAVRARIVQKAAGPGTVSDIARVVEGAALRRGGEPAKALDLLAPLVSKLVDGYARGLLNEEIVASAVEAGAWARALSLMSVWLREAGLPERATVRGRIEENLQRVPTVELVRMLDAARGIELATAAEEELEIRKIVAQRLSLVARADKDVALSQHLLTSYATLLGDHADAIAQLASGAGRARVEPRTVGLLLSLRNAETRRRGAEIASGVAFGLGFPTTAARLVSRDGPLDEHQQGRIADALGALAADGASVVIAGGDEAEATLAAQFAEAQRVPVLLLHPPSASALADAAPRFSFVVGVGPRAVEDALVVALAARVAGPIAILADAPRSPRRSDAVVRACSEAAAPWKPLGVGGVVVLAPADCALAAFKAGAPAKLRFALGLEADGLTPPPGTLVATAGLFPVDPASPAAAFAPWLRTHAAPPSFWAALGRDAAVLAWEGVKVLPEKGTEDPGEVTERRAQAAASLAAAQADLWTTDAKGFAGARVLARTVGVREVK